MPIFPFRVFMDTHALYGVRSLSNVVEDYFKRDDLVDENAWYIVWFASFFDQSRVFILSSSIVSHARLLAGEIVKRSEKSRRGIGQRQRGTGNKPPNCEGYYSETSELFSSIWKTRFNFFVTTWPHNFSNSRWWPSVYITRWNTFFNSRSTWCSIAALVCFISPAVIVARL